MTLYPHIGIKYKGWLIQYAKKKKKIPILEQEICNETILKYNQSGRNSIHNKY
jgi:hypothetical protein